MAGEFINDTVLDQAVNYIDTNADILYVCSQAPTTFTEAESTYKLGTKTGPTLSTAQNASSGTGRATQVSAFSDGVVDSTGTATHWALVDDGSSLLLAAGPLGSSQGVTATNAFSLTAFEIIVRDATVT